MWPFNFSVISKVEDIICSAQRRDRILWNKTNITIMQCFTTTDKETHIAAISAHRLWGKSLGKCRVHKLTPVLKDFVCLSFKVQFESSFSTVSHVRVQVGHRSEWKGNVSVHTALDTVYLLAVYPTDPLFTTSPQDICNPQKWHMKPSWFLFFALFVDIASELLILFGLSTLVLWINVCSNCGMD